jgi:hypothetical protein
MSGEPVDMEAFGEYDFDMGSEDNFNSNMDTENYLRFFVDTLEMLQLNGGAQAASAGMSPPANQAMQRLIQTHNKMLQHFQREQQNNGIRAGMGFSF